MKIVIFVICLAFLVDGVKILIESFSPYKRKRYRCNHAQVSVIIPLYNKERELKKTLKSVIRLFSEKNILIIDDGSTDRSLAKAKSILPMANFISTKNQGKVRAVEEALKIIQTPFVFLLDADSILPSTFRCPISLLEKEITAVAFNIMPEQKFRPLWKKRNLLLELQGHEYAKSMQIGRKFQHRTASVQCISGAAGLFKTARLKKLTEKHTKVFPGEDLERTLIELASEGKVVFVDQVIKTCAPDTLIDLIKQRMFGWWPGLWRNIPLFFKLVIKRNTAFQLKGESVYQLVSLFLDPFKLVSLVTLLYYHMWTILAVLLFFYLIVETIVYSRIKIGYTERPATIIALYSLYNLLQMILRLGGLMVFIWNQVIKKNWPKVTTSFLVLALLVLPSRADNKKSGIIDISYQKIVDSNHRTIDNCNAYFGLKGFYLNLNTAEGAPRYLILGQYIKSGKLLFIPEVRIKKYDRIVGIAIHKPILKSVVIKTKTDYVFSKIIDNFTIFQLGADYYWKDYNFTSLDVIKEFGRKKAVTVILKNHLALRKDIFIRVGAAINNLKDKGFFVNLRLKQLHIGYSSFQNFDYYEFNRQYFTVGMTFEF